MNDKQIAHAGRGWLIFGLIMLVSAFAIFFIWFNIHSEKKREKAIKTLSRVWAAEDAFFQDVGYYADSLETLTTRTKIKNEMRGPYLEMPEKEEGLKLELRLVDPPEEALGPGAKRELTEGGKRYEVYLSRGEKLDGDYLMLQNGAIYVNTEGEATPKSEMALMPRH